MTTLAGPAAAGSTLTLQNAMDTIVRAGYPAAYVNDTGRTAASGVADLSTGQPATADLNMRAGSVTKTFVATVLLQLVAEGQLRLGDTVERWLPGLLPYGRQVSLQMLLQHTSGIPDYWEDGTDPLLPHFLTDPEFRDRTWTPQQLVQLVAAQPQGSTEPLYSNTNFIIAGMVIERATGNSIGAEIRRRIVGPLRLTHTSFPVTSETLPTPFVHGYSLPLGGNGQPVPGGEPIDFTQYNPSALWATGALISNPADLNVFNRALLSGQLLPADLTRAMKTTVPTTDPNFPPGVGFGLGIWSWDIPCPGGGVVRVLGHEGEVPGYNTYSFASPDGRRSVTMQATLLKATDQQFNVGFSAYESFWTANC
jgi:D-alanyl-D-alanine carboxypeptidase